MTAPTTWHPPKDVGDRDATISDAKHELERQYGYAKGVDDGTDVYTQRFGDVLKTYGPRVNDQVRQGKRQSPYISEAGLKGVYDWTVKTQLGIIPRSNPAPVITEWRPIFFFSAPGSGANNLVGPSSDVGNLVSDGWGQPGRALHVNHWRLNFPIGGYLGLMGGDPGLSYKEVIAAEGNDLELQIGLAIEETKRRFGDRWIDVIEFWFSGYSQSADGMVKAVLRLFGDGGKYAYLRHRINGLILFGNPARQPGLCRIGRNLWMPAPGWGISRDTFPDWLNAITYSITTVGDMYACAEDNTLLPGFYDWFVEAETSLGFIAYSTALLLPVLTSYLGIAGPLLGGIFGGAGAQVIALATGVALPFLSTVIGAVNAPGAVGPDPEFVRELSAQGLMTPQGITRVFGTLRALPGIQTHGEYFIPKPEFGGRTGVQVGYDIVADFRR